MKTREKGQRGKGAGGLSTVALVVMGVAIAAGWALIIVIQYLAAQCGWWGLLIPSVCFTLAIFGRAMLGAWRRRRIVRASLSPDLDLTRVLQSNRRAPLVEPREAARLRPIIFGNLQTRLGPNGKTKHERNPLP